MGLFVLLRDEGWKGKEGASLHRGQTSKSLFLFLLLGFHLPVREKWAKMYLSIFLKCLSFFR